MAFLFIYFFGIVAAIEQGVITDFQDRVAEKVSLYNSSCLTALNHYLFDVYGNKQQNMWMQSLHGINDVNYASQQVCDSIFNSSYTVINFNASSTPVVVRFGICLPSVCNQQIMDTFGNTASIKLTNGLQSLLQTPLNPNTYVLPNDTTLQLFMKKSDEFDQDYWLNQPYMTHGFFVASSLALGLVTTVVYCSIVHKKDSQKLSSQLSIQSSLSQLTQARNHDDKYVADNQDLDMFDSFRVLCLVWILCFGTCQFTMSGTAYNPWTLQDYFLTIAYTLVYSANLGFDEFFMLGTFFAYLKITTQVRKDKGSFRYFSIFFSRYLRLAPAFYLVFLFGWLIGPYLNSGPWWYTYEMGFCDCQHYWWAVIAMAVNEYPGYVVANEGCYYWGWYVASDMQLFVVVPVLVYLLQFKMQDWAAKASILLLLAAGTAVNYWILYENNMAAGLFAPQDILIYKLFINKAYTKFHAVALGLLLARIYIKINDMKLLGQFPEYKSKLCPNLFVAILCFVASLGTVVFVTTYSLAANKDPSAWSRVKNANFVAFSRPAFLLGLIGFFTLLFLDYSRFIKRCLSAKFWTVLSRLSYSVYLIFPIVAGQFASSMTNPLYLTYSEMFYLLIFNILSSFIVGFIVYLFIERPCTSFICAVLNPKNDAEVLTLKELEHQEIKQDEVILTK